MSDEPPATKAQLQKEITSNWEELNRLLDSIPEAELIAPVDAQGWAVKDHVTHMTAWERSVVFLLQGKPRHEGLGVAESLYDEGDDGRTNEAIYRQHKDLPPAKALAQFRAVHSQLLSMLEPLTDADLHLPYRHYLPDEPGEGDGPAVFWLIVGNTVGHFQDHSKWIKELMDVQS